MFISNSGVTSEPYQVATPIYQGPLDLLLQLIERAELDITRLSLALVTDQYLKYLENLAELSADMISAFLVVAAKLIQIKSESLLPRPPIRETGEEDPGEALARQLVLYRQYKRVADSLDEIQKQSRRTYLSLAPVPEVEGKFILTGAGISDLVAAYLDALSRRPVEPESLDSAIAPPKVTIRQKIRLVTTHLRRFGRATFRSLLGERSSREEIGITFLAMLELVKLHFVDVHQEGLFAEIHIEAAEGWDTKEEFELEFGE
ncbi:MAG: segregation/condensation protein A [Chloroflexota bacterium]|nr:MAG: segregation/condensation protein A [Chloroflexota bacterium]